jgi:hypothetical protein
MVLRINNNNLAIIRHVSVVFTLSHFLQLPTSCIEHSSPHGFRASCTMHFTAITFQSSWLPGFMHYALHRNHFPVLIPFRASSHCFFPPLKAKKQAASLTITRPIPNFQTDGFLTFMWQFPSSLLRVNLNKH